MASLEDQQALLLYRVGPVLCCAPSLNVLSIIQPVPLTHPPGSDAARPGIFRHSGHVVKAEELRVRFGVEEKDRRPGRMIIAELDSGPTAFWVDDIIDVVSMPGAGWGQAPPHLPRGIFSRTLLLNENIYLYAEFDALQKLHGHGLLKTYIEKLLAEERPQQAADKANITTTAPVASLQTHTPQQTNFNTTALTTEKKDEPATIDTTQNRPAVIATRHSAAAVTEKTPPQTIIPPTTPVATDAATGIVGMALASNKKSSDTIGRSPVRQTLPASGAIRPVLQKSAAGKVSPATIPTETARPTAVTPRSTTPPAVDVGSGFPRAGLLLLMLLLVGAGGSLYYYSRSTVKNTATVYHNNDTPPSSQNPFTRPVVTIDTPVAVVEQAPPVSSAPTLAPTPVETIAVTAATPPPVSTAAAYQAKIEQDAQGITIVIKAPKDASVFNSNSIEATSNAGATVSAAEITPTNNTSPAKTSVITPPKPRREEIIHIIVKGDTLWHIAKRYVNNPFRYPELARLSNIKNPDLIYPGNRVRIIREFN